MSAVLTLRELRKSFVQKDHRIDALRGVDLDVEAGEMLVLRGRSGSGKSTLLAVAGLLARADSGTVIVDGKDASDLDEAASAQARVETIGVVFQAYNLLPHLTAAENVALAIPGSASSAAELALLALETVGLGERAGHRPAQLSGGEQQRVAVARALVNRP